jgi:hypothetical protein
MHRLKRRRGGATDRRGEDYTPLVERYGTDSVIVADSADGARWRIEMLPLAHRLKREAERVVVNADAAPAAPQKSTSLAPASICRSGLATD